MFDSVTSIAFYLPQFHPTPFNDENWSPGFSEWTNVAQGRPRFEGHNQPKIPGELGFYDLRYRPIFEQQISLAQAHGLFGFCFYYYRFGTKRELELPVNSLLSSSKPNLPFCLCWANESWTRAWDGRSDEVIRQQSYDSAALAGIVDDLAVAMVDRRYIRLSGKPVFLIYQLEEIPDPVSDWLDQLREGIRKRIGEEIILGCVYSHKFTKELSSMVDFVVQFPPHRLPRKSKRELIPAKTVKPFDSELGDYFESYDRVAKNCLESVEMFSNLVPGVCPDWDNSVRRAKNAHVLIGSTPEKFSHWVSEAGQISLAKAGDGKIPHPLLFVNAWNEWGEGAALEPSLAGGRSYIEAFRNGLANIRLPKKLDR